MNVTWVGGPWSLMFMYERTVKCSSIGLFMGHNYISSECREPTMEEIEKELETFRKSDERFATYVKVLEGVMKECYLNEAW